MPNNITIPTGKEANFSYDSGADVLYISFGKPEPADDSHTTGDTVYRTKGNKLVGITILDFKSKIKLPKK